MVQDVVDFENAVTGMLAPLQYGICRLLYELPDPCSFLSERPQVARGGSGGRRAPFLFVDLGEDHLEGTGGQAPQFLAGGLSGP